ncbi:MAG: PKD domain-containing protein [Bacteroidales bacterium]|jgi:uncharacterized protein (TIGR02145 family)
MILVSGIFLMPGCKREEPTVPPLIVASVSPAAGNTTQVFTFDLSKSDSRTDRGDKVFTRWDWNGDGKWDTPFTRMLVFEHRYHAPGTWKTRLEMSNLNGTIDTLGFVIQVEQGYSPPNPVFRIFPDEGHIFTRYLLDASGTRDDEDSLDQLTFRWDFNGDGTWDTHFGDSVTIFHVYPEAGFYQPKLQVRDPSGLISPASSELRVTTIDKRLYVSFKCIPDSVTHNTPIIMDASATTDLDFPDKPLQYRWDWEDDDFWDTDWQSEPITSHVFRKEYFHSIRLQVRSFRGLTNDTVKKIRVYHQNQVPRASFYANTLTGNTKTEFRLDCWPSRDVESSPSDLSYRWDFDGDGNWDTDFFTDQMITMHRYSFPGTYHISLVAKDQLGEQDTCTRVIHVSNGLNETGLYQDRRGDSWEYYGTVHIGNQWWFTRNMSIHDTLHYNQFYYNNSWANYYDYGNLYGSGSIAYICPPGWRLPSKEDWDKLFANYPEDRLFDALMPGGESDFGLVLGGSGKGTTIVDIKYQGIDQYAGYWTLTKPAGAGSTSLWMIEFDLANRKILKGYNSPEKRKLSVRCVKDE